MITIRKALRTDAQKIISFQQAMAWETEQLKLNEEKITLGVNGVFDNPARGDYYVAEADGGIVASLLITYEWSDWRNAEVWWFQSVYVLPEFRRKGIFSKMFKFISLEAENRAAAGLRLYVELNNNIARKTYESLGMTCEHYTMYELLR